MTFYDVNRMEYKDYEKRVKDYKPYRGTNAYPVGSRRYSARHFVMRDDGVVEVYYSGLPYKKQKEKEGNPITPLLYIHPDNTVEFNRSSDVGFLSKLTGYWVRHDVKYGGTVVSNLKVIHPVFKGARFSLETYKCLTPYEWHHPRVNRKKAKETMSKYDEFLKLHKVFLDPMSKEGINGIFEDFHNEIGEHWEHQHRWDIDKFDAMVESKRHVDAAVYLNVVDRGFWWIKYAVDRDIDHFKEQVCKFAQDGLKKVVYKYGSQQVFDYREIPAGGHITSSKWRIRVTSNGQGVERP
jgi:hypothetical protein